MQCALPWHVPAAIPSIRCVGEPLPLLNFQQPAMVPVAKAGGIDQGMSTPMCPITLWPAAAGQGSGVSCVAVLALSCPAGNALPNAARTLLATFAAGAQCWSGGVAVGTLVALCCCVCGQAASRF